MFSVATRQTGAVVGVCCVERLVKHDDGCVELELEGILIDLLKILCLLQLASGRGESTTPKQFPQTRKYFSPFPKG